MNATHDPPTPQSAVAEAPAGSFARSIDAKLRRWRAANPDPAPYESASRRVGRPVGRTTDRPPAEPPPDRPAAERRTSPPSPEPPPPHAPATPAGGPVRYRQPRLIPDPPGWLDRRGMKARRAALKAADPRCRFCGRPIRKGGTLDHLTPRSRGGGDFAENLTLACGPCNAFKGSRTVAEFAALLARAAANAAALAGGDPPAEPPASPPTPAAVPPPPALTARESPLRFWTLPDLARVTGLPAAVIRAFAPCGTLAGEPVFAPDRVNAALAELQRRREARLGAA